MQSKLAPIKRTSFETSFEKNFKLQLNAILCPIFSVQCAPFLFSIFTLKCTSAPKRSLYSRTILHERPQTVSLGETQRAQSANNCRFRGSRLGKLLPSQYFGRNPARRYWMLDVFANRKSTNDFYNTPSIHSFHR